MPAGRIHLIIRYRFITLLARSPLVCQMYPPHGMSCLEIKESPEWEDHNEKTQLSGAYDEEFVV